jgi:uncharacterized protein YuzE
MPERPAQGQTRINFFVLAVRLPLETILAPATIRRYRRVTVRCVEISGFAASGTSTSRRRVRDRRFPTRTPKSGSEIRGQSPNSFPPPREPNSGSSKVVESEEVKPGIVLDFNAKKQVVGIEVLNLKRRVPKGDLQQLKILVA